MRDCKTVINQVKATAGYLLCPAAGLILGLIAWRDTPALMPLSLFMPVLWYKSKDRFQAYATVVLYTLAATRSLPQGTAAYYGINIFRASLFCVLGVLWANLPYLFLHFKNDTLRKVGLAASLVLVAVPPFGITGWAHPFSGIGFFWPGGGFLALCTVMAGLLFFCSLRFGVPLFLVVCLTSAASLQNQQTVRPGFPWVAVNTSINCNRPKYGFRLPTFTDFAADYHHQIRSIRAAQKVAGDTSILLLPEGSGGTWLNANAGLWRSGLQDLHIALVGATLLDGRYKINSVVEVTKKEEKVVYLQRMPVPLTMWWPGRRYSYDAAFFKNPIAVIDGRRVAFFICYEQFLVWPVIESALRSPDIFCATSNLWWARNTNLPTIQNNIMHAWARLFGVPLLTSTNF
jgi:hypothetical protein